MRASWASLVLAGGCTPATGGNDATDRREQSDTTPACAHDLGVEIGTGQDAFVALEPNQPVTMIHGPQGGWHVWAAGLVTGSTAQVRLQPRVVLDDGVQVAGDQPIQYYALVGYRDTSCDGTFYAIQAFLDDAMERRDTGTTPMDVICGLAGRTATLSVDVGDLSTGEQTTDAVDVTLALDPAHPSGEPSDVEICAGS